MKLIATVLVLASCEPPLKEETTPVRVDKPAVITISTTKPTCTLVTAAVPFKASTWLTIDGYTEDEIFVALAQFLTATGITVAKADAPTRTITTRLIPGQTLLRTCAINDYRSYAYRIVVSGHSVNVGVDCWESMGHEASVDLGSTNRGSTTPCRDGATAISKSDAKIPSMFVEGAGPFSICARWTTSVTRRRPAG
jgi:hypothetical protein